MKHDLIFGGTSEGVALAKALVQAGHRVTVSVATDYGALMLNEVSGEILVGRLDSAGMEQLMKQGGYDVVWDATHPYAAEVTKNIREAARKAALPYQRILRPEENAENIWMQAESPAAAGEILRQTSENILLTTGSKDLKAFTVLPDYRERVWVRILASEESLHQALTLGYPPNHIIAMHGPFSTELNAALLRQFSIGILVTKHSGQKGGFGEKLAAAAQTGTKVLVIDRPLKEQGITLAEAVEKYR